ncbi:MAG: tetratricopeptide repeat protein [Deltaproteobacteria bacterium]|nr:tetratricopeptide repeat protein [Deltaproteobacteria bacterium]
MQRGFASITKFFRTTVGLRLLICLLLAGATLAPYVQVKDHAFITFDDDMYVTANPVVRAGFTWPGVKWAFTAMHSSNWHPLTWLSHMLDCRLFGLRPRGHHLMNVAWHLANTILLFLFWAWVTRATWPSAMVAALFALHPLHVESVAWVAERKNVLSTFFWLGAMLAYAGYVLAPSWRRYLLILLCLTLGLLAKAMLVTLPFVLLLLDYWPLGRIPGGPPPARGLTGNAEPPPAPATQVYGRLLKEKLPLFALVGLACLITMLAQRGSGSVMPLAIRPLGPRIANALVAYVDYVVKLFWPYPMSFFYKLAPVSWWLAAGAGLALLGVTACLLYWVRRRPYLLVGWLWYLGTLVPVIGIVQVGGQAMADRFAYIPFIGLFVMIAWGVSEATAGWRGRRVVLSAIATTALLACLVSTWVQIGYWRNSETLFNHALKIDPNNYIAYHHLGMALANEGKIDQAIAMYQKTLAVAPQYPPAYNNLAILYAEQGRYDEAVPLFKAALRLTPNNISFYGNLALAYQKQGKMSEAEAVQAQIRWLSGDRSRAAKPIDLF